MVGRFLQHLYESAEATNRENIRQLVRDRSYEALCDLGCDDGSWTVDVAMSSRSQHSFGIEVVGERARSAHKRGVKVAVADLARDFPFEDQTFDLVHSNQVIEHVPDVDHFLSETHRILRIGGSAVISTENGSSWHNIFAATMGWQIFSLTNVSELVSGIGNPLALHRGHRQPLRSWKHRTIFNFRGLIEILELHRLSVVRVLGAGYYPLPAGLGRMDPRHSHFITAKATKRG